jgi:hypothetical protein
MTSHELFEGDLAAHVFEPEKPSLLRACYEDAPEGWLGDPEWPSLFLGPKMNEVYVYCELFVDEFEELAVELLSAVPDVGRRQGKMTWLEHELNVDSFAVMLGLDHDAAEQFALENGLCPDQWFVLKVIPHYWEGWCGDFYEYDFEVDFDLISAQRLSPEEHAKRWSDYWTARGLAPVALLR